MFWKSTFMDSMRAEWLRRIAKVQYYANGKWYDAKINEKRIEGNTLYVTTTTTDSEVLTITAIRLIDTGGNIAGETSESLQKADTQGIITLWEFPLYEITNEEVK